MRSFALLRCPVPFVFVLVIPLLAAGCGDTDEDPRVTIVSPAAGSTLALGMDMKARFVMSANDFSLKPAGQCGGDTRCGVAYLNIDGDACNQPGQSYNAMLADGPLGQDFVIQADFSLCAPGSQLGSHNVTISLRRHDGSMITGEGGVPAQATVSVTTVRE